MNTTELENHLRHINAIEEKQRETGESINDYAELTRYPNEFFVDPHFKVVRFPKDVFFNDSQTIFMSRHNRFAPMVEHLHDFIEMIYVYEGECRQTINGEMIHLPQGSLCALDRDVPHSIEPLGENDILINILINEATFSSLFLYKLQNSASIVSSFLADAFNQQASHDKYVIFDTKKSSALHHLIQLMLCEFWSHKEQSQIFLNHYLQLLLMELIRIYSTEKNKDNSRYDFNYVEILSYIDDHYKGLKIADVAQAFSYNPNYLSNKLKQMTGKNFQEILLEKRLILACDLLQNTDYNMDTIAMESGFNSTSYFFRQFKKKYQVSPASYRKNNR